MDYDYIQGKNSVDLKNNLSNKPQIVKSIKAFQCNSPDCGKAFERKSEFLRHKTSHALQKSQQNHNITNKQWIEDNLQSNSVLLVNKQNSQPEQIYQQFGQYVSFIQQRQAYNGKGLLANQLCFENVIPSTDAASRDGSDRENEETAFLEKMIKLVVLENQYLKKKLCIAQKMAFASKQNI